jgi:hypothetical protein
MRASSIVNVMPIALRASRKFACMAALAAILVLTLGVSQALAGPEHVSLPAGWNLVAGGPGSDVNGAPLFEYVSGSYMSVTASNLQAGHGYWVNLTEPATVLLTGTATPSPDLEAGWTLVGNSTDAEQLLPVGVTAFIYTGVEYVSVTRLKARQAGWVRSASPTTLGFEDL